MLRVCLRNTFLDVERDEDGDDFTTCRGSVTVGSLECSPTSIRSRSADGCSPNQSFRGGRVSPQIERLNVLLSSCAERRRRASFLWATMTESEDVAASSVSSTLRSPVSVGQLKCSEDVCSTAASEQASDRAKEYCHKLVPRRVDMRSQSKSSFDVDPSSYPTTLMIRNVPNCYTQLDLLAELNELGFGGSFDFMYLPLDKSSKASVGYAFVNFTSPLWAASFAADSQGHRFCRHGKNKEVIVSVAHLQGLAANLAHYEKSAVKSAKVALQRPLVLA